MTLSLFVFFIFGKLSIFFTCISAPFIFFSFRKDPIFSRVYSCPLSFLFRKIIIETVYILTFFVFRFYDKKFSVSITGIVTLFFLQKNLIVFRCFFVAFLWFFNNISPFFFFRNILIVFRCFFVAFLWFFGDIYVCIYNI